jgi:hypothetical protein
MWSTFESSNFLIFDIFYPHCFTYIPDKGNLVLSLIQFSFTYITTTQHKISELIKHLLRFNFTSVAN